MISLAVTAGLLLSSVSCGKAGAGEQAASEAKTEEATEDAGNDPVPLFSDNKDDNGKASGNTSLNGSLFARPALFDVSLITHDGDKIKASVPEYKVQLEGTSCKGRILCCGRRQRGVF